MRPRLLAFVGFAPMLGCSDAFVTAPAAVSVAPILVDAGVILLGDLNPADIEQIEVIKGPATATIYGETRCPPILIRTRRPSSLVSPSR